jgi:hypothetical protein
MLMIAWSTVVLGWGGWIVAALSLAAVAGLLTHHARDHRRWSRAQLLRRLGVHDE